MPRYNTQFDLTVEDMDVIEEALRAAKTRASSDALASGDGNPDGVEKARKIRDLLGRLHNQKVFYRPKQGVYISG